MSEALPSQTVNVFEVDPAPLDPASRKAILAMQAARLFVEDDDGFERVNVALHDAAQAIAKPPTMTYEDLIFTNPVFDKVRVISSDEEIATHEAHFYQSHRVIERSLYGAVGKLVHLDGNPQDYEVDHPDFPPVIVGEERVSTPYGPVEELDLAVTGIVNLHGSLTREVFGKFRPYFMGFNGLPGPSGLYSETIPILDLLIHGGSNISETERDQLRENLEAGLYPDQDNRSALLKSLLEEENPRMYLPGDMRQALKTHLNRFRRVHTGSVKKLLPDVYNGDDEGSGGVTQVAGYLNSKVVSLEAQEEEK